MQSKERLGDTPPICELQRAGFEHAAVVNEIDRQLHLIYSGLVAETIPAKFYTLLDALEENSERKRRAS